MGALMNRDPIARELATQRAWDSIHKNDDQRESLKKIKKRELSLLAKQPLKKFCRPTTVPEQMPSQVFLIDQPVITTFSIDLPLESLSSIHSVRARIISEPTSQ